MKKVSIIIPVYNSAETLEKCLDSVICQSYKNIEIICVNDGSTDNSVNIIKKYLKKDTRINFINQKINSGPAVTKNTGITAATGDYLAFVDSDDYINIDMIEKMVSYAEKNELDIVRCHYNNYVDGNLINQKFPFDTCVLKLKQKEKFLNMLLNGDIPAYMQLIMINKKLFRKNKISIGDKYYLEDLLLYIKLLSLTDKIGIVNIPLYNYVNNSNGLTFSLNIDKIFKRIDGLLYYNKEAKKIVKEQYQKVIIDSRTTYLIIHFLYELLVISSDNESSIISILKEEQVNGILKNTKIMDLKDAFTKISYICIKFKSYKLLFSWFYFAKKIINLKRKLRK